MKDFFQTMKIAASGMKTQGQRLQLVSENVANADTPGYRRKIVSFRNVLDAQEQVRKVGIDSVSLDQSPLREVYDPSHPMADENGTLRLSNVNAISEIADAREAQRSYQANLNVLDQSRRMYASVLDLLRR